MRDEEIAVPEDRAGKEGLSDEVFASPGEAWLCRERDSHVQTPSSARRWAVVGRNPSPSAAAVELVIK